jgi:ketosteroid isomerase-like protein
MSLIDEIQRAQDALAAAVSDRDAQRASEQYTQDARLMAHGLPTFQGRDAVKGFFEQAYANGIASARFTTLEVEGGLEQATEIGQYELFAKGQDGALLGVQQGRYFIAWRKVDGAWRIHRDMFNLAGEAG